MIKRLFSLMLFLIVCISCTTTRYIEKETPVETIKTEYINNYTHDSIYVKDSIITQVVLDTIKVDRYHTKYIEKVVKDTIIKVDSIPTIVTITKEVEVNKMNRTQSFLSYLGGMFLMTLILVLIFYKIDR